MSHAGLSAAALAELKRGDAAKDAKRAATAEADLAAAARNPDPDAMAAVAQDLLELVALGSAPVALVARTCVAAGILGEAVALQALADVIWSHASLANASAAEAGERTPAYQRLGALVGRLVAAGEGGDAARKVFTMTLELDLLAEARIISHEGAVFAKMRKLNTSMVYLQHRYNLMQEETEGYAKLLTLLNDLNVETLPTALPSLHSLIGYFDLDPNRVLDLILDAFELNPANAAFLELLPHFRAKNLPHMLGLKFARQRTPLPVPAGAGGGSSRKAAAYAEEDDEDGAIEEEGAVLHPASPTPVSLYRLAALLLSLGYVELSDLLPYLDPSLQVLQDQQVAFEKALDEEVRRFGRRNLNAKTSGKDAMPGGADPATAVPEDDPEGVPLLGAAAAPFLAAASAKDDPQLLGLLVALIDLRCWSDARSILKLLGFHGVEAPRYPAVAAALERLLHYVLDAAQAPSKAQVLGLGTSAMGKSPGSSVAQARKVAMYAFTGTGYLDAGDEVGDAADKADTGDAGVRLATALDAAALRGNEDEAFGLCLQICDVFGIYAARDPSLLFKLCRFLAPFMAKPSTIARAKLVLKICVLPGLSLQANPNPGLAFAVFDLLSPLPYGERYELYDSIHGGATERGALEAKHALLCLAEAKAGRYTRYFLKRLSAENAKPLGRQMALVAHLCPHVLFRTILQQLETYGNLIQPVVDAFKSMTPYALDVLSYSVIVALNSNETSAATEDGLGLSPWLQGLAQFVGVAYRKYPQMELRGVLRFLLAKLKGGEGAQLIILKELLDRVGGATPADQLGAAQAEGRAGGLALRRETASFGQKQKLFKRAYMQLKATLVEDGFFLDIAGCICKLRRKILYLPQEITNFEEEINLPLKVLAATADTCQSAVRQLVDFISATLEPSELAAALAPPPKMVEAYGVDLGIAFRLARPLYRAALLATLDAEDGDAMEVEGQEWCPFGEGFADGMKGLVAEQELWAALPAEVFAAFWVLGPQDLEPPTASYDREAARLRADIATFSKPAKAVAVGVGQEKQDFPKLLEAARAALGELEKEHAAVRADAAKIRTFLKARIGAWWAAEEEGKSGGWDAFLQSCLHPRALLSPEDAMYASRFALLLAGAAPDSAPLLPYIEAVGTQTIHVLHAVTEDEASNLSFFFRDLLSRPPPQLDDQPAALPQLEERILALLLRCLGSEGYSSIRSALIFLANVAPEFPSRAKDMHALSAGLARFQNDERPDIKVMTNRFRADVEKRLAVARKQEAQASRRLAAESRKRSNGAGPPRSRGSTLEGHGSRTGQGGAGDSSEPRGKEKRPRPSSTSASAEETAKRQAVVKALRKRQSAPVVAVAPSQAGSGSLSGMGSGTLNSPSSLPMGMQAPRGPPPAHPPAHHGHGAARAPPYQQPPAATGRTGVAASRAYSAPQGGGYRGRDGREGRDRRGGSGRR